jgi:hypothetical protein
MVVLDEEATALTSRLENSERAAASREIGRGIRGCLKAMKATSLDSNGACAVDCHVCSIYGYAIY